MIRTTITKAILALNRKLKGIWKQYFLMPYWKEAFKSIGDNVYIGDHSSFIFDHVEIGNNVFIGEGASFIAANDGVVTKASFNTAYGNMVIIDNGGGVSTLYAHGSEILVTVGQTVKKGDSILKVGSTGYSTGPHAHFEIRINGNFANPEDYFE